MSGEFIDTNILVYSLDSSAGRKHIQSVELIDASSKMELAG